MSLDVPRSELATVHQLFAPERCARITDCDSADLELWPRIRQAIYATELLGVDDRLLDRVAESVHAELLCADVSDPA